MSQLTLRLISALFFFVFFMLEEHAGRLFLRCWFPVLAVGQFVREGVSLGCPTQALPDPGPGSGPVLKHNQC